MIEKYIKIFSYLIVSSILYGCSAGLDSEFDLQIEKDDPFIFGYTNLRILEFSNVQIRTFSSKIVQLYIGFPGHPYQKDQGLYVRLPDGDVLNLSSPDILSKIKDHLIDSEYIPGGDRWSVHNFITDQNEYWQDGTERYFITENIMFFTNDQQIVGVYMRSLPSTSEKFPLAVGLTATSLFELPLSTEQIKKVFGQPVHIYETFHM